MNLLLNLLPPERMQHLLRAYHVRLAVVGLLFGTSLIAVAALLLLPAYRFATDSLQAQRVLLESREAAATTAQPDLTERLEALEHNEKLLLALRGVPSASATIRQTLEVPHVGVRVVSISYTPPTEKQTSIALIVSGIATSRDALQAYERAFKAAPFVTSVNLPLSAYAKDTAIPFAITITFAP